MIKSIPFIAIIAVVILTIIGRSPIEAGLTFISVYVMGIFFYLTRNVK